MYVIAFLFIFSYDKRKESYEIENKIT